MLPFAMRLAYFFILSSIAALLDSGCKVPVQTDPFVDPSGLITDPHYVKILPQFYDGVLFQTPDGIPVPFNLNVRTAYSSDQIYEFWDFGDGTTDDFVQGGFSHDFPYPDNYLIKVDVYSTSGTFIGRDTTTITINYPDFSIDSIKSKPCIELFLTIDTNTMNLPIPVTFPIAIGLSKQFAGESINWSGNDFIAKYDCCAGKHMMILQGSLSDDGKKLTSVSATIHDELNFPYCSYSFNITDIPLISVGSTFLYRLRDDMQNNLHNVVFSGAITSANQFEGNIISFNILDIFNINRSRPQCFLVFRNN